MIQAHLKSRVGRKLFTSFLLARVLPVAVLAWYAHDHVSDLLMKNEYQRMKQESKAYGMTLIDGLTWRSQELERLAARLTSDAIPPGQGLTGFLSTEIIPTATSPDMSPSLRHHLELGRPILDLSAESSSMLVRDRWGRSLVAGRLDTRRLWRNDAAPEHYCVLAEIDTPLYCTPGLTQPAPALWPAQVRDANSGVLTWRTDQTEYLGAYWRARLEATYHHPGFIILVANRKADAMIGLERFRDLFPAIVGLALALAAWLAIAQIRRQTRPLDLLAIGTQRLAAGEFETRVPVLGKDEFGDLARSFNLMAQNLWRKFQMLGMMAELDRAILNASEMEHVIRAVLNHIRQAVPCDVACILQAEPDGRGTLSFAPDRDADPNAYPARIDISGFDATEFDPDSPWFKRDLDSNPPTYLQALADRRMKQTYLFPVRVNARLHGFLILGYRSAPDSSDEITRAGTDLAARLSVADSNIAWEEKLYHQAHYDALTDLPNRVLLRDRVAQALIQAERDGTSVAVILIDLDNFKQVNDSLGHSAGDTLLIECAKRLLGLARRSDTVARLGGDEFILLLPSLEQESAGAALAEVARKINDTLADPLHLNDRPVSLQASLGIALFPENAGNFEDLIKMADAAMYESKRRHPGGFRFFSHDMDAEVRARFELSQELRHAISNGELLLYYQPKVEPVYNRIVGAEALVRWQSPKRGLVPPGRFVPLLQELGLGPKLDEWVLDQACAQLAKWQSQGMPAISISVNMSTELLASGRLLGLVRETLERHDLAPERLELEILEETAISAHDESHDTLTRLRQMGVNIALDDFGTGYSSLVYLTQIPANILKIDQIFIQDLLTNPRQKILLVHLLGLANALNYTLVAEGVEAQSQLDMLRLLGCDLIQGYLYSKPLPAKAFAALLREGWIDPPLQLPVGADTWT